MRATGFEIAVDLSLGAVVLYLLAHPEAVGEAATTAADLLTQCWTKPLTKHAINLRLGCDTRVGIQSMDSHHP
jgi:hypothetical protein